MARRSVTGMIVQAARQLGVPPQVALGVAQHESDFSMDARGAAGEIGIFQVMPNWWDRWARSRGWDIRTTKGNIMAGVAILKQSIAAEGGNVVNGLRRYNGGPMWMNKPQTATYAQNVLGASKQLGESGPYAKAAGNVYPVPGGRFISHFGADRDGGSRKHEGIDLAADRGAPVLSFAPGVVTRVRAEDTGKGYGRVVYVQGVDGREYRYAHLEDVGVEVGQRLTGGQPLGTVGDSGNASGTTPHLHFEIRVGGNPIDPQEIVANASQISAVQAQQGMRQSGRFETPDIVTVEEAVDRAAQTAGRLFGVNPETFRASFQGLADSIIRSTQGVRDVTESEDFSEEAREFTQASRGARPLADPGLSAALDLAERTLPRPPDVTEEPTMTPDVEEEV